MRQRSHTMRGLAVVLVLGLLLAACGAAPAASEGGTIVFGATISITGKTAKEGEYTRDGYQMFIDTINEQGGIKVGGKSYKAKLIYYDDESKSEITARLYEKLINEDKVNF